MPSYFIMACDYFFCLFIFQGTLSCPCVHALLTLIAFKNQMVPSLVFCFTLSTKWWHISVFSQYLNFNHICLNTFSWAAMIIPSFSLHKHPFFVKPQDTLPFKTSVRCKMWDLYLLPEEIFLPAPKTLRPHSTLSSLRVLRSCSTRSQIRWPSRKQGWLVYRNSHYGYNMRRSRSKAKTRVDYVCIYSSRRSFFLENHTREGKGREKQKKKGGRNEDKTK